MLCKALKDEYSFIDYYNQYDCLEKLDEEGSLWVIHSRSCCQGKLDTSMSWGDWWQCQCWLGIPGIAIIGRPRHGQTLWWSSSSFHPDTWHWTVVVLLQWARLLPPYWLRDCNRAFWLAAAHQCVLPGDWAVVRGNHGQGRVSLDNWAWADRVHQISRDN